MPIDFLHPADRFTISQISFASNEPWTIACRGKHMGSPLNYSLCGKSGGSSLIIMYDSVVIMFSNALGQGTMWTGGTGLTGAWHHFMFVADGAGNIEYFYDNGSQGSKSHATPFNITDIAGPVVYGWTGPLSEFAVFEKALSVRERSIVYNNGIISPRSPLLVGDLRAYWPLDDAKTGAVPATIVDAAGIGGYDGTPQDDPVGYGKEAIMLGGGPLRTRSVFLCDVDLARLEIARAAPIAAAGSGQPMHVATAPSTVVRMEDS